MTPSVIEPTTYRRVAQCLNQVCHRVSQHFVQHFLFKFAYSCWNTWICSGLNDTGTRLSSRTSLFRFDLSFHQFSILRFTSFYLPSTLCGPEIDRWSRKIAKSIPLQCKFLLFYIGLVEKENWCPALWPGSKHWLSVISSALCLQ